MSNKDSFAQKRTFLIIFKHTIYVQTLSDNKPENAKNVPVLEAKCNSSYHNNGPQTYKILSHISYDNQIHTATGESIKKLCYSGQDCHKIPEALVKLYGHNVQILDLSYNSLTSLQGLDGFTQLQELILDNNQLTDNMEIPFLPLLHTLSLNKNKIMTLEEIIMKLLEKVPVLTYLSLLGNRACPDQLSDFDKDQADYQRYRYFVLHHIPKLKFLDSTRVTDSERNEAKRIGKFMKVVRPDFSASTTTIPDLSTKIHDYTPLSEIQRNSDDHRGAYGRCKYRYSGKHSEGNRFIFNSDL